MFPPYRNTCRPRYHWQHDPATTHLRVTQSTVSKRLAVPECEVGRQLTDARYRGVRRALPELELIVNGHRSPVAIDRVRSGEYALALVAGFS